MRRKRESGGVVISIHAPRAGGDLIHHFIVCCFALISIHAPRAGGDDRRMYIKVVSDHFNPRPPCGGRQKRGRPLP